MKMKILLSQAEALKILRENFTPEQRRELERLAEIFSKPVKHGSSSFHS